MDKFTVTEITDRQIWEKFILSRNEANFLQSYNWGDFHKLLGKTISRVGFLKNQILVGVMLSIVEKAKRATYLTIPGGPIIDWGCEPIVNLFKETIQKIARQEKCSFVRVRPQILENEEHKKLFESLGFKNAPMHLHAELTHQLDLTKSEEELLAQMRKQTRYEIKQAIKLGINVEASQNSVDLDSFYDLQSETAKRQGFVAFDKKFLTSQFSVFANVNQAMLYTSFFEKKKLAQAFIIFYGNEADYHYGASTLEGRQYPGAYLIQWETIKEAKKRGISRYNFWGVAPEGEIDHRFYGVSVFKRGFGGEDVQYLHAQDLVVKPLAYKINWAIETFRKRKRRV